MVGELIGLVAVCIPIIAIVCAVGVPSWSKHKREMLELQMRLGNSGDSGVMNELRALRDQITDLRDTTTRYDMSFDAALQRMESRMAHVENRVSGIEQEQTAKVG